MRTRIDKSRGDVVEIDGDLANTAWIDAENIPGDGRRMVHTVAGEVIKRLIFNQRPSGIPCLELRRAHARIRGVSIAEVEIEIKICSHDQSAVSNTNIRNERFACNRRSACSPNW